MTAELRRILAAHPVFRAAFGLGIIGILLWLPFGFNVGGTVEEWLELHRYYQSPAEMLALNASFRPLVPLPYLIGYTLTPYSFVGLNLLYLALIWAKGCFSWLLLRRLSGHAALSFAAAALVMVYPADSGIIGLRTISIQMSLLAFLAALYYFLKAFDHPRAIYFAAMLSAQLICLLIYEAAYPLILLSPLLLAWLDGKISRRILRMTLLWYLIPLLTGIGLLLTLNTGAESRQGQIFSLGEAFLADAARHTGRLYLHNLLTGWIDAARRVRVGEIGDLLIGLIGGGIGGLICWSLWEDWSRLRLRGLLWIGLVAMFAAFAVYLPTSLRAESWRVFLFVAAGAALSILVALMLLLKRFPNRQRLFFATAAALLISLGAAHTLFLHRDFVERALRQQAILAQILGAAPEIDDPAVMLLTDDTLRIIPNIFVDSLRLEWALRVLYDDPDLIVQVCYHNHNRSLVRLERCHFEPEAVTLRTAETLTGAPSVERIFPYAQVLIFHHSSAGELDLAQGLPPDWKDSPPLAGYAPENLICADCPANPRAATLLMSGPLSQP